MNEVSSAVVHFYRAIVMHADVWRERLDATTNWAVVTTIGVISFAFARPQAPHFILLLLISACGLFLIMESRRYQTYDLWRRRIRSINKYIIAPRIAPDTAPSDSETQRELASLAEDLGRAVPHLRFIDAVGYRLRRNYGYIYLFAVGSWAIKLYLHPAEATTAAELVSRAEIAMIPGTFVLGFVSLCSVLILFLALRAPSEQMLSWRRLPSPLIRLRKGTIFPQTVAEEEEERDAMRPGALTPAPILPTEDGDEEDTESDGVEDTTGDDIEKPRTGDED